MKNSVSLHIGLLDPAFRGANFQIVYFLNAKKTNFMKYSNPLFAVTLAIATIVGSTTAGHAFASEPAAGTNVTALRDLVGAKAGQAENEIKQRGYRFVKGADGYTNWIEPRTNYCVSINTQEGRYASIVYAGNSIDCKGSSTASNSTSVPKQLRKTPENLISTVPPKLKDLVGAKAGQAEGDLVSRGYTFRNTVTFTGGKSAYYVENQSGFCVEVGTVDGRFSSIVYNSSDRCKATN